VNSLHPSIDYKIYRDEFVLIANVSVILTFSQMNQFSNSVLEDSDYVEGMNGLYVLTGCVDLNGTMEDVVNVANFLNNPKLVKVSSRTSIILPNERIKLKRYVESLLLMVSSSKIEHKAFTELQKNEAYEYIGLSNEFVIKHLSEH